MRIPLTGYGRREILLGSLVCIAALVAGVVFFWPLALIGLLLWGCLLAFFRDPERSVRSTPDTLLSPADGVVQDIQEVADPPGDFLSGPALRIGIFMSILNCHVNRSPAAGTVRFVRHYPGRFHDARDPRAASENEHNLVGVELPDGRRILVNQIAGRIARRIVCAVQPGDTLEAGERFGMVKFGSRLELFVPASDEADVTVRLSQKVKAGIDALASYKDAP